MTEFICEVVENIVIVFVKFCSGKIVANVVSGGNSKELMSVTVSIVTEGL